MPIQTFTLPKPPAIPTGREIYDSIMRQIEPELVSASLPTLKEKYKGEKREEKESRKRRYNDAFAKYHEMYATYIADLDARIHRYRREAMHSIEEYSRTREDHVLEDLEASMFKLT